MCRLARGGIARRWLTRGGAESVPEVATAKQIGTLGGLDRYSTTLAYTPDAKRLLTGRSDNHFDLLIWDAAAMLLESGSR